MSGVQAIVNELEGLRLGYFEQHPGAMPQQRDSDLQKRLDEALLKLDNLSDQLTKAELLMFQGRLRNQLVNYDGSCEDLLSKVKLKPDMTEGWNELGECLWKRGDIEGAKVCFETALEKERDVVSLRNYATALRQVKTSTTEERNENLARSYKVAKEAADLAPSDPRTRYMLGNACLALFFASAQRSPGYLQQALDAYAFALEDPKQRKDPDLHYNFATSLKYEESYAKALEEYKTAYTLDPTLTAANDAMLKLVAYLDRILEAFQRKGKLKPKRVKDLCRPLKQKAPVSKALGPYGSGSFQVGKESVRLVHVESWLELTPNAKNENVVVVGVVVGVVHNEDTLPYTFVMADADGLAMTATVYNFSADFGVVIGQHVAIPEPFLADLNFTWNEKKYQFQSIRIPTPEVILVNGKRLSKGQVAPTQLSFTSDGGLGAVG